MPGPLTATESGFYTWVWEIDKTAQGENGKYIRGSFTDWFGRVAETHVTPFQPEAVSKTDARRALPGDEVTDTITVSSTNGAWLRIDGEPIPASLMAPPIRYRAPCRQSSRPGVRRMRRRSGTCRLPRPGPAPIRHLRWCTLMRGL